MNQGPYDQQNTQQGYEQSQYGQSSAAPQSYNSNAQNYQENNYGPPTQGSGYVQRAAHGAVLSHPAKISPPSIEPSSDIAKTSPYFSRLAKLKRMRQMAKKAKT